MALYMENMEEQQNVMKAVNIKWDVDEDMELLEELPTAIEIPEGMADEGEISDYLSDVTGFCHMGYVLVD